MFYADAHLLPGARLPLPDGHEDRGVYVVEGAVEVAGVRYDAHRMMIFRPGDHMFVTAMEEGARLMLLGGETFPGPRYIWWNFVASSVERIEAAKEGWARGDFREGPFRLPLGDEEEYVRLPEGASGERPGRAIPGPRP
jgi:redox-sensitive bicupin YhaK (pirin superfamily)